MSTSEVVKVEEFAGPLAQFQELAKTIVVNDAATCLAAKTAQRDIRTYMKDVHSKLDPFVVKAKASYDGARDERDKWIKPAEVVDDALGAKVKEYEREEKRRADEETARVNRERVEAAAKQAAQERADRERQAAEEKKKKIAEINAMLKRGDINRRGHAKLLKEAGAYAEAQAAEAAIEAEAKVQAVKDNPVSVKPKTVAVAGVPSRTNYKAEVTNADLLLNYWKNNKDPERVAYLRRFITVDEQKLGQEARDVKDSKKLSGLIPGVRFYED